jgi:hypothetical protein
VIHYNYTCWPLVETENGIGDSCEILFVDRVP